MYESFHIGCKALIINDGRVLCLRKAERWDLPGGRVESGENLIQALCRELEEELPGIGRIRPGPLVGSGRLPDYSMPGHELLLLVFLLDADVPEPLVLSAEHNDATWMEFTEAQSILQIFDIDWANLAKTIATKVQI